VNVDDIGGDELELIKGDTNWCRHNSLFNPIGNILIDLYSLFGYNYSINLEMYINLKTNIL
jgi:hypothetical protein